MTTTATCRNCGDEMPTTGRRVCAAAGGDVCRPSIAPARVYADDRSAVDPCERGTDGCSIDHRHDDWLVRDVVTMRTPALHVCDFHDAIGDPDGCPGWSCGGLDFPTACDEFADHVIDGVPAHQAWTVLEAMRASHGGES